ncbi:MAG: hypothetical protein KF681_15700 [Bdellovibrionaceae bacterium]|nr:hypothetical protein [Pseudobdellovibrionaceae bacterium]
MKILVLFLLISSAASAQVDLSTRVLVSPGKAAVTSGLESGRYQKQEAEIEINREPEAEAPAPKKIEIKAEAKSDPVDAASTISIQPRPLETPAPTLPSPTPTPVVLQPTPALTEPSVVQQVESLVKGEEIPQVELYRERVHPDDTRLNRVEIEIASGMGYLEAVSNSAYRSFASTSSLMSVGGSFWMTPFIGVSGRFQTALTADIPSAIDRSSRVVAHQDWSELELNFRKFFGLSRKANSIEYGLSYSSFDFKVPSDETSRVSLKSNGLGLKAMMSLPTAPSYTWRFGGSFYPRIQHSESATGLDLKSGSSPESSRVDLLLGGDFKLSRENALFWDLSFRFEKNQFSGSSNVDEPGTTAPAKNVSVQNSSLFLLLGYRWGQ